MRYDPDALIAFLEDREAWVFGYGAGPTTHDCARFCGAGVEAVTGVNPLTGFSSRWTTRRGARRVLAAHGGMAQAVGEVMCEIAPSLAPRGMVGMLADEQLVLFEGETLVGPGPGRGLVRRPRAHAVRAWAVKAD